MADTRQEILDAALVLFSDQGYDKTSLREIAEQVGVTKAALYYHFRSKEDILLALVEPILSMQNAVVDALRSGHLRDPSTWQASLDGALEALLQNRRIFALIERNGHTLLEIAHQGEFAETHLELHRLTEEFFTDDAIALEVRVRLACAFGAISGVMEVGGTPTFGEVPADELRQLVRSVIRDVLAPIVEPTTR